MGNWKCTWPHVLKHVVVVVVGGGGCGDVVVVVVVIIGGGGGDGGVGVVKHVRTVLLVWCSIQTYIGVRIFTGGGC